MISCQTQVSHALEQAREKAVFGMDFKHGPQKGKKNHEPLKN